MEARGALKQAQRRLRLAGCPYRLRVHPGRNSPYLHVYETRRGGRTQSAKGYRAGNDDDLKALVEVLLQAQQRLEAGGPGLDWDSLNLPLAGAPSKAAAPQASWGEIRAVIKADIAPGGPKAKDRNPFACFSDQGYFGRAFADGQIATTLELEQFCLHTPASLDAQRRDPARALVPRQPNSSGFLGVIQMVNYLAKKGIAIASPELQARLEQLKTSSGKLRAPSPRFIPTTCDLESWLDALQQEDPLRGWAMATLACYSLRPHELWHIERLPGESQVDPTFMQISLFDSEGGVRPRPVTVLPYRCRSHGCGATGLMSLPTPRRCWRPCVSGTGSRPLRALMAAFSFGTTPISGGLSSNGCGTTPSPSGKFRPSCWAGTNRAACRAGVRCGRSRAAARPMTCAMPGRSGRGKRPPGRPPSRPRRWATAKPSTLAAIWWSRPPNNWSGGWPCRKPLMRGDLGWKSGVRKQQ